MKSLSYLSLWLLSALLFLPVFARAAGVQVSPARLQLKVSGKSASSQISVVNPTPDVALFSVYPDDFALQIKANPASFILDAGSRKSVNVVFTRQNFGAAAQALSTNLSVVGKPLAEGGLQAGTGVKIPLTVTVLNQAWYLAWPPWAWAVVAAPAAALGWGAYRKYKIKRPRADAAG